ncbi:MAG: hypothetical protein LBB64_01060 [Dysgonamonadaceae bacterium]|nr:hypothetical protein [Dysgonamonadaceae bacterium]
MITIYSSPENKKRLEFAAGHLFRSVLGVEFQITSDPAFYRAQTGPCIFYSDEHLSYGLRISPHGLLSETGVRPLPELQTGEWKGLFCFFHSGQGDIPFDVFAASFYLLSLYEEYLPSAPLDEHGRFDYRYSLLYRNGCLEIPIIDRWAYQIQASLEKAGFSTAGFPLRPFRAVDTYDIDHPFRYRYKGWLKNTGGILRDALKRDWKAVGERLSVLFLGRDDPYMQAIRRIRSVQQQSQKAYYLFVLLGKSGKFGRSTVYPPKAYYRYLKALSGATIGLHPSYETYPSERSYRTLTTEKQQLETILQQPVSCSRQHFLRMQTPGTFRALLQAGIREDFTLAFAQAPGFRSGTAIPHPFYDIQQDEPTALLLRPTVMMDSTLIIHWKLSPEAALEKIKALIDACKQSGGDYLSLWHNSNLAGSEEGNPWIRVWLESRRYAGEIEKTAGAEKISE